MAFTPTDPTKAEVRITGVSPNQQLEFYIPRGSKGDPGANGATGPANTLQIGSVTTGAAGSAATASITGQAPSQTLNLTIPQGIKGDKGVPGDTSVNELRGQGMPDGVVSASPGTYYTDTAGTNGAWRWLKTSGTGSTGWTVIHGDTGWRYLDNTTFPNHANSEGALRRQNGLVSLKLRVATVNYGAKILDIPAGFKGYDALVLGGQAKLIGSGTLLANSNHAGANPSARMTFNGGAVTFHGIATSGVQNVEMQWVPIDAWPTTLPGITTQTP